MSEASERVRVTEVGPRDGLQNEKQLISVAGKIRFIDLLSEAGYPEIEVSSFVSAKRIPQLGDAAEVFAGIARRNGTLYSALVPNERGLEAAMNARVDKVAVFAAASEGFSQANTGGSIAEVLARIEPVVKIARATNLPVRGYVSCVVRCPYDGPVEVQQVCKVVDALLACGVTEIDLGETLGVAVPEDIEALYAGLASVIAAKDSTLHLHDTNGRALENIRMALALGVRSFDSSAGGLGGCPFAVGARGNIDSLQLLVLLSDAGFATGIESGRVSQAISSIRHDLRSP